MDFNKYKSIENTYREKYINDKLKWHPQYATCKYIATEKIHGSNFQVGLTLDPDSGTVSISYGSRTTWLTEENEGEFYNFREVTDREDFQELIENFCVYMREMDILNLRLYGELGGPGIQKGVYYGEDKFIVFFDIMIDDKYLPPNKFLDLMSQLDLFKFVVPVVRIYDSLEEALEFDIETFESYYCPQANNIAEGVVIKPFDIIVDDQNGDQVLFYIKKKSDKYKDRQNAPRSKTPVEIPQELADAQHAFSEYLTDVRLQDLFSKHGMITQDSQMGRYIKLMMEDAKEDFLKDCRDLLDEVADKDKRKVFAITGRIVSKMLMKYV